MKRIWLAFLYSIDGILAAWRDEPAFKQEAILAAIMIPAAFMVTSDPISLILLVGSVLFVLALELLNTAVEAAINRIGSDIHPLSKKAKDTASAAVLIALINAAFIWSLILFRS